MSLRGHRGWMRSARTDGSTDSSDSNPINLPEASAQMSDKDRLPSKSASAPPLEFGPDGEIEFKEAVPRRRNDVLRILREEAAHATVEEQQASVQQAPIQAKTADGSKAVRSENSRLIVRAGKTRSSDGSETRAQATASSGWLRAFIFTLAAIFAIAAFTFQFATDIGTWAPWLQPYLTEYVDAVNRLALSFGELL